MHMPSWRNRSSLYLIDTLRSILNEAFENSSKDSCSSVPVGNKAGTVYDDPPRNGNKNTTANTANVIDLTLDEESSNDSSSPEGSTCSELDGASSSSGGESSDEVSEFEPDDLISYGGSFSRKRKHSSLKETKGKGRAEGETIQAILSGEAFIRLYIPRDIHPLSTLIL